MEIAVVPVEDLVAVLEVVDEVALVVVEEVANQCTFASTATADKNGHSILWNLLHIELSE